MDKFRNHTAFFRHPYGHASDLESLIARDRALLYIRGMDIDAVHSVEVALRSLRHSQSVTALQNETHRMENPDTHETDRVMTSLFAIMEEMNLPLPVTDGLGNRLVSAPPMNRRPMIAEPIDKLSLFSGIRRALSSLWHMLHSSDTPQTRRQGRP